MIKRIAFALFATASIPAILHILRRMPRPRRRPPS